MSEPPPRYTFDSVAFGSLVQEFAFTKRSDTEEDIRRKLLARKLGPYDQSRVDVLRRFKDTIQEEVQRGSGSIYFVGSHDGALEDFDRGRMTADYHAAFPEITISTMEHFVDSAIYWYYLR